MEPYTSIIKMVIQLDYISLWYQEVLVYNMEGTPALVVIMSLYPADADFSLKQSRNLSTNNCLNNLKRKVKNILYIR